METGRSKGGDKVTEMGEGEIQGREGGAGRDKERGKPRLRERERRD